MSRLFMTTDAVGGVWRYSVDLGARLRARGWTVRLGVVGPTPSFARRDEATEAGLETETVGAPLDWLAGDEPALAAGRAAIAAAAARWRADVIHLNQPAYAGTFYPAPCVVVAHSCVETWMRAVRGAPAGPEWRWHREAVQRGLSAAAVAVAPSSAFAAALAEAYGLSSPPAAVPNGAPDRFFFPRKGDYVLAAGRAWDESKNFPTLNAAAAQLRWPVRLAGPTASPDGEEPWRFDRLICLGALDAASMAAEFAGASVFVSPSLYEPFGLAVLEAAQAGAALALADLPAFRELWDGAATFFHPRDPDALAYAVNTLIVDDALRARLAKAARTRAADYSIDRTAAAMAAIYGRARACAPAPAEGVL